MLLMLEMTLMAQYFYHSSRPLLHRAGVAAILAFDIVCTAAVCAQTYSNVLVYPCVPGDIFAPRIFVPLAVILFATYATASLEQAFLLFLYFSLFVWSQSKITLHRLNIKISRTKNRVISGFLVASIAVHVSLFFSHPRVAHKADTL
jgi:hypothetical protein